MTQYEIILAAAKHEMSIIEANRALTKIRSDVVLSARNLPTVEELEANVAGADPAKCSGVGFMNHGVGDNEKIYVKDGKLDQDVGFYVTEDEHAPKAFYTIVSKDGEGFFRCDGDKIVKL